MKLIFFVAALVLFALACLFGFACGTRLLPHKIDAVVFWGLLIASCFCAAAAAQER